MGTVYLARQDRLGGRLVALKVLPQSAILSSHARERFVAEANTIARLRHPNIVTVHDVVHEHGVNAYAMEWVDGRSLAQLIDHLKGLDREPTTDDVRDFLESGEGAIADATPTVFFCRIALSIARALSAVQESSLIHRDVKPSNILLRRDGTPLLSDFGLVRDTDSDMHTETGHFLGTPAYAAAEQLRGQTDAFDARTDVYGLGVTLYHALTLQLPFRGRNSADILRRIEAGSATPPRKLNPRLPRDLQTIVAKAMEPDPARRYQRTAELADDLERLLTLQPIKARPASLVTRSIKAVRRNRRSVLGAILGAVFALALTTAAGVYFLAVPRWAAERVRLARLTLLNPVHGNDIFSVAFFGASRIVPAAIQTQNLVEALGHYDAAAGLARLEPHPQEERNVLAKVLLEAKRQPSSQRPSEQVLSGSSGRASRASLPPGIPSSPRGRGLYALLTNDTEEALAAWSRLDAEVDPDPFVEASLGILHLADGEPARAYPRLQNAAQAFANVSFLTQYLADAALQCGDVNKAARLIELAKRQPMQDNQGGLDRVTADVLAAQGRDEAAESAYRALGGSSVAQFQYARFLESRGRLEEAVRKYSEVVRAVPHGDRPRRAFIAAMDRWWASLSDQERRRFLRGTMDEDRDGFPELMRTYRKATADETDSGHRQGPENSLP